jgi:hypothetical protein
MAATITASDDKPTLCPYSSGSMTLLLKSSSATNRPTTIKTCSQPGAVTRLTVIGSAAATHGPMYGM